MATDEEVPGEDFTQRIQRLSLSEVEHRKGSLEKQMEILDDRKKHLEKQREDVRGINEVFRSWLTHLQKKVERNSQLVPYLWCVKDICKTILETLGDRDVPAVTLMCERLEELRKLVTKIDQDEVTYKPGFVEDMHHVVGTLLGITGTLMDVYF